MKARSCVTPEGFVFGIHKPAYEVVNLRESGSIAPLGVLGENRVHGNLANFPEGDVSEPGADWVYEIANPFFFRGVTYINRSWADRARLNPLSITIPGGREISMGAALAALGVAGGAESFARLPEPVLLALATTSTDPEDLMILARLSCELVDDSRGRPQGLRFEEDGHGRARPRILRHDLFEAVANNPHLPDPFKEVMVLRPGVQGASEIVGEWQSQSSHVYEYLRRNSYIPWGHYASNMADDAVRYSTSTLGREDIVGLRHLYYQRTYVRLAALLGLAGPTPRRSVSPEELETLRLAVVSAMAARTADLPFTATLWGWNYGFDFAPSGYRLHASHQQIHQQYALVPGAVAAHGTGGELPESIPAYGCGDLVADCVALYRQEYQRDFFADYIMAIRKNRRMDNSSDREQSLIVYEDANVLLFVPKAQTSQWELQLVTVSAVGNILEADSRVRASLDQGILLAQKIYSTMGARMVTSIEFTKRFDSGDTGQRLLYSFLPRLPWSPGAFSEAQLRFICGHYPEDFAAACRARSVGE